VREWWSSVVRVVAVLWLLAHFTLTTAYVMPLNPVTVTLQPLLQATIGTYFPQGWSFFAPDPGWSVPRLFARPLTEAEVAAIAAQGLPPDGWYDLSTPLWERFHDNRLSAYARVAYPQLRATLEYSSGGPDMVRLAEACRQGDGPACESYEAQRDSARARAGRLLARIAAAFCNEVLADQPVTHVALKLRERPIAAWTERNDASPPPREVELGVFPIDRSVTAAAIWRGGRPE
jgi:hypothetical protein